MASQGLPLPCWVMLTEADCVGQGSESRPPCLAAPQSWLALAAPRVATVRPATACDSKRAANLFSANTPHRLAVVVSQAARCWRPSAAVTRRGNSSFQAGSSTTAAIRRTALASPLSINHHQ